VRHTIAVNARMRREAQTRQALAADKYVVRVGALAPLSRPGWVEAGEHLLAGLELAVRDVNDRGGIAGRPLELVTRDSAADPQKAVAAVEELAGLGVSALVGEYHSVVARAIAAKADALQLPFLCSSAVLDELVAHQTDWVGRLAPPQSKGWRTYADFLLGTGHSRIAVVTQPSIYWASGTRILGDFFASQGGGVVDLDASSRSPAAICDDLVSHRVTAVLLLVGYPQPAASIVQAVRRDARLTGVLLGAPAGQPEFADWVELVGEEGAAIPFLRYMPERLGPLATRIQADLGRRLSTAPSFVALEGYDAVIALAELLCSLIRNQTSAAEEWGRIASEGSRGPIRFSRQPGVSVWQWEQVPIQVVDRNPAALDQFRVLFGAGARSALD